MVDTRESYWHEAAGGQFSPSDLHIGESLLVDCGFLEIDDDELVVKGDLSTLVRSGDAELAAIFCAKVSGLNGEVIVNNSDFLEELVALISDPLRQTAVAKGFGGLFDDSHRQIVGRIGEEVVLARVQTELSELGHSELLVAVRHVSLYDDTAGYDIAAPCLDGSERLLEVKSTTREVDPVEIFLSRNEANTGLIRNNWCLVICQVTDVATRQGKILGWVPMQALLERLPLDVTGGVWQKTKIEIPSDCIVPGLPSAIP
ncbi:MAG: DUF3883 domain-containing protein [Acidobacteria bacterium]|nr:DUF3883 domain-containing protein [Acidobacteriota bacterium]